MIKRFASRAGPLLLGIWVIILVTSITGINLVPAASKHQAATTSSVAVVLLNSTDGLPHYGQQITFRVSTTVTDRPYVKLDCYQDQVWVYDQWAGFFPDFPWTYMQTFPLSNGMWTSGAADCTATLYYYGGKGTKNITTNNFHVSA